MIRRESGGGWLSAWLSKQSDQILNCSSVRISVKLLGKPFRGLKSTEESALRNPQSCSLTAVIT